MKSPTASVPKPLLWGIALGFVISFIAIFWLTTFGHWCLGCLDWRDGRMDFFTAQGRSVLGGHFNVSERYIGGECFKIDKTCYGYFGVAPSILRMPYLLVSRGKVPDITQVYFLLGFLTALTGTSLLLIEGWRWFQPKLGAVETFTVGLISMIALGIGSPLFFLGTRPFVYEEAILWGAAFAILSMWAAVLWLRREQRRYLALALLFALMAALSRPHLGLAGTGAIGVIALYRVFYLHQPRRTLLIIAFCLPVLMSPFVVNVMKFGTPSVPYDKHVELAKDPAARARVGDYAGENPKVIPTQLADYFLPNGIVLAGTFPFIDFGIKTHVHAIWPAHDSDLEGYYFASLSSTGPLFVLAILLASYVVLKRRGRDPNQAALCLALSAAAFLPLATTLSFFGVVERYKGDALPFIVWSTAWALPFLLSKVRVSLVRPLLGGMGAITAYQCAVVFGLSLLAYPGLGDAPQLANQRIRLVANAIGVYVPNPVYTSLGDMVAPSAPVADADCAPDGTEDAGDRLTLQLKLPKQSNRVEALVQYRGISDMTGLKGTSIGYANYGPDRAYLVMEAPGIISGLGPFDYGDGAHTLDFSRIGRDDVCVRLDGTPMVVFTSPAPLNAPRGLGKNRIGARAAIDDFTGQMKVITQAPAYGQKVGN